MPFAVRIPLFHQPAAELEQLGAETVTPEALRQLGDDLRARLRSAAELLRKLSGAGWTIEADGAGLVCSHPAARSEETARELLHFLGIDAAFWGEPEEAPTILRFPVRG